MVAPSAIESRSPACAARPERGQSVSPSAAGKARDADTAATHAAIFCGTARWPSPRQRLREDDRRPGSSLITAARIGQRPASGLMFYVEDNTRLGLLRVRHIDEGALGFPRFGKLRITATPTTSVADLPLSGRRRQNRFPTAGCGHAAFASSLTIATSGRPSRSWW
jgi:hypothetical protein